jgi:hypothetical protein
MKPDGALRHFLIAFALAAVGYFLLYTLIERRRTKKGPWEVTFSETSNVPCITIDQPWLGITNVHLLFRGQIRAASNVPVITRFNTARPVPFDVPYGEVIFLDTTFLPGTVTLRLFNHEIELLPRVLVVDHAEHPWKPGETIEMPRVRPNTNSPSGEVTGKAETSASGP